MPDRPVLSARRLLLGFVCGFVAVLVFHQGTLALLNAVGFADRGVYPMDPTEPFGVPQIWSAAFWGGVWGVVFVGVYRFFPRGGGYWLSAFAFGALALSLVAWLVVLPLKGQPAGGGWEGTAMLTALMINGMWGLGTALLLRVLDRWTAARPAAVR